MKNQRRKGIQMFRPFDNFFKSQSEKDAETERMLELLKDSEYAKQLRLERDNRRVGQQTVEFQKLEPIRQQRDRELPMLQSNRIKAEEKEKKLLAAAKEATRDRIIAADEESKRSWCFSHQEELILAEIKSLAPACIDDFKAELWQLETETRNAVRTEVRDTKKSEWTGGYSHRFESNIKAIEKRVAAIREARKQAEDLKKRRFLRVKYLQSLNN
jgi:hypothetical protein